MGLGAAMRTGLANLRGTVARLSRNANVGRYLIAHLVYTDGLIALFAFGGIYAAGTFGWTTIELGLFGILLTITGTFGAIVGGRLDDRLGPKPVIVGALAVLILSSATILSIDRTHILFFVAVAPPEAGGLFDSVGVRAYLLVGAFIGAVAGPLQAASPTRMARVSPRESMTEFFGFYALSGKLTSFAGPLAVGVLTGISGSQRIGISVLLVFFAAGALLLVPVRAERSIDVSGGLG
jgi:UMF1 family MFS transporter